VFEELEQEDIETELIKIGGAKPDLILILVVWLGLVKGSNVGCISGFFFGLFEDGYSGMSLGSNALTKTILGFFCGLSGKRLYTQSLFSHILCVGIGSVVDIMLLLGINGFVQKWETLLLSERISLSAAVRFLMVKTPSKTPNSC